MVNVSSPLLLRTFYALINIQAATLCMRPDTQESVHLAPTKSVIF